MTRTVARMESTGEAVVDPLHVARTMEERTRGLLGRTGLDEREGMWFPACRMIHTFGMQFAIDLVYLNEQLEVCKVVSGLRPSRLSACLVAESVIELASGAAKRMGLRRGVRLSIAE